MRLRSTYYTGDHIICRSTVRGSTRNIRCGGPEGSVVLSTADYDSEGPDDYKFFSELGILENNLSTVLVTSTIGLGEFDGETSLPSINDRICGKVHRKASSIDHK